METDQYYQSLVFWTAGVGVVILALAIANLYEWGIKAYWKDFLFYITLAIAFLSFGLYF